MNTKRFSAIAVALVLLFGVFATSITPITSATDTKTTGTQLVSLQSVWKYLDDGTDPASSSNRTSWTAVDFNDSGWKTSSGDATFGAKSGKLQALDSAGVFLPKILLTHYMSDGKCVPTYFFRTSFNLDEAPSAGLALVGSLYYDDAAIVYVNGTRVAAFDEPEGGFESNLSYGGSGAYDPKLAEFTADASLLKAGKNVISVEVHNQRSDSSDVYFEMARLAIDVGKPQYLTMNVGEDETKRNFTWYFNSATGAVQFAESNGGSFPTNYTTVNSVATAHNDTYIHRATISGLKPSTKYAYRVLCGNIVSETFYFETDSTSEFNFIFVGDPQLGGSWGAKDDLSNWTKTLNKAEQMFPDTSLLVSAGDQVETYGNETHYANFLAPETLSSLAIATTIGNHDTNGVLYSEHFNNPNTTVNGTVYGQTPAGGDYWYTYNNVLFMHLNINNTSVAEHKAFMEYAISQYPEAQWKIVVMHFAMYGAGSYYTYDSMTSIRNEITPVFDKLDIDVVLSGHEHIYARSYMINKTETGFVPDSSKGVLSSVVNPTGILYLTGSSSSGSKYYDMMSDAKTPHIAVKKQHTTTFSNVEIDGNSFKITTYSAEDGSVIDSFEIIKDENLYSDDTSTKINNNLASGKEYTTSLPYRQGGEDVNWEYDENAPITYPDYNSKELTDGYVPNDNSYKNAAWFGLHHKSPDAIEAGYVFASVDLGESFDITKITVYLPNESFDKSNGVTGPKAENVSFFADGTKIDGKVNVTAFNDFVSAYSIETELSAKEVEVRIVHGGWSFIAELAVEGKASSGGDNGDEDQGNQGGDNGDENQGNENQGNENQGNENQGGNENKLLKNSNVISVFVTSLPEGYEFSFDEEGANKIADYLSNLNLISDFDENPDTCVGMTWVISLEYKSGENQTVYLFGNMFIKTEGGRWYQLAYEEADRFHSLVFEIGKEFMIGDVNSSNEIDSMDYVLVKRAYFGTFEFNENQFKRGDVNKSGDIDSMDYVLIKRAYFGTFAFN